MPELARLTVRVATPADAAALARLRFEFRAGLGRAVESAEAFLPRCAHWMAARLAPTGGSPWRCWVLEHGHAVVGAIWVQLLEKIPNPVRERERHAYVTNLYVQPPARGGAGARLLAAALAWCREQDVDQVFLWPSERSRSLYARHGFAGREAVMAMRLSDAP